MIADNSEKGFFFLSPKKIQQPMIVLNSFSYRFYTGEPSASSSSKSVAVVVGVASVTAAVIVVSAADSGSAVVVTVEINAESFASGM